MRCCFSFRIFHLGTHKVAGPDFLKTLSPQPKWWRYFLSYASFLLCSATAKMKVTGKWNLPKKGPYVIASNHFSYFDPLYFTYGAQKPLNFIAASDQEVKWYFLWAPIIYGLIPVDRQALAPSSIKKAIQVLRQKEILSIFPEGMQTSRALQKPKNGAIFLSTVGKAPIVPMAIYGAETAWEDLFRGVRPRVRINIGKPFGPFDVKRTKQEKTKMLEDAGHQLMCRIAALLPTIYHGVFLGDPTIDTYKLENGLSPKEIKQRPFKK